MTNIVYLQPADSNGADNAEVSIALPEPDENGGRAGDLTIPTGYALFPDGIHFLSDTDESAPAVLVCSPLRVETIFSADGQTPVPLATGDTLSIRRSRDSIRLLHLAGSSFFETLRRKLNWSGSNV